MAHIAYGFNPGAILTGNIVEDERVWGATEWGIGYVSPFDAPPCGQDAKSHCDGICLDSSVWLDGVQIDHYYQHKNCQLYPSGNRRNRCCALYNSRIVPCGNVWSRISLYQKTKTLKHGSSGQ